MRRVFVLALVAALLATFAGPATFGATPALAASPQTYQVGVGWENPNQGIELDAYFPSTVTVHVGDKVHWTQNTNEPHTVTFLGTKTLADLNLFVPAPPNAPSPAMINSLAAFPTVPQNDILSSTSTFASSGLMSKTGPFGKDFTLTFTTPGTYNYLCLIHGAMMSGKVVVVGAGSHILPQQASNNIGHAEMLKLLAKVPSVFRAAESQMKPSVKNADGSVTHFVMLGFSSGQIDLMRFFPTDSVVRQGDTVTWYYSNSDAPHTVTFLNGAPAADLVMPFQGLLLLNPAVLFPSSNVMQKLPLTRNGEYSSGLLSPGQTYSLKIGNVTGQINYVCLLHDDAGMRGSLWVTAGTQSDDPDRD